MIKLIYDKYENDLGFIQGENEDHTHTILTTINENPIKIDRKLTIHTWGIKKHESIKCDIIFDATLFSTKIDGDIKYLTGIDEKIQKSIINHPKFDIIIDMIVTTIETNDYQTIGIICNYGKHRSVGWAELVKKLYYTKSIIIHHGL